MKEHSRECAFPVSQALVVALLLTLADNVNANTVIPALILEAAF